LDADEDSARLRQFAEELISVSNEVAESLEGVTDAASATRAAPKVQPLIDRQDFLMNQLAAAKVELGRQKYNEIVGPHRTAITTASLQATQAHAKVFGNSELLLAWQRGLKNSEPPSDGSATPATEDPVENYLQQAEHFAKMNQQFCGILDSASDRASAQAAAEQIRAKLPEYERAMRQMTAAFLRLSDADKDRAMQELARRPRPHGADIVTAITRALRGPAPEELRPVMGEIMNVYVNVIPGEPAKQKLRKQMIDLGL
jgi:hypothetical protein